MKKLKYVSVMLLAIIFLLVGCGSGNQTPGNEDTINDTTLETTPTTEETTGTEETQETAVSIEDQLADLIKDEYDALEINAELLERKAILPGSVIPITVTIKNNGEQTIVFPHGSSSSEIPEALLIDADGLQHVLSESQLGIATLDMVSNELTPGEEVTFVIHMMAIEPNDEFANYTFELYNTSETYIGDMTWEEIQAKFPDLTAVTPGSFDIHVYFTYYILTDETRADATASATGYAQTDLTVLVIE